MTQPTMSRRGRPSARTGSETRDRILAAARACFAELGYDRTTNKAIAAAAGISAPAIYHYFPSKPELFAAVVDEAGKLTRAALAADRAEGTTLAGHFGSVLRSVIELHRRDPVLAGFSTLAAIEIRRHPELQDVLGDARHVTLGVFDPLVSGGRERGELCPDVDDEAVVCLLAAVAMGLTQRSALVDDVGLHPDAPRAVERLLAGTLFAAGDPGQAVEAASG